MGGFNIKFLNAIKKHKYEILSFLLLSIACITILYILNKSMFLGDDLKFHKARIDGLVLAYQQGNFFPRINYAYLNGFGYATGIFYSDFFLLVPVILQLLGFSPSVAYVCFLVTLTFATFLMSYFVRYQIDYSKTHSYLFSLMYTLSVYRYAALTRRGALGEILALIFLPLILYGIYHILYKDYKKWYLLTIGMSCLILSHLISTLLVGVLIVGFLLLNVKTLWKEKERLVSLTKATLTTIPLVSFYLVPIFEQLSFQDLQVEFSNVGLTESLLTIKQAVMSTLLNDPYEMSIGLIPVVLLLIYTAKWKNLSKFSKHLAVLSYICLVYPVVNLTFLDNTFMNVIQFPWRTFSLATLLICWLISSPEVSYLNKKKRILINSATILVMVVTQGMLLFATERYLPYSEFNDFNDSQIGFGEEYLPLGTSNDQLKPTLAYDDFPIYNNLNGKVSDYKKDYDTITFKYNFTKPTEVTLPYIMYKGYVATANGKVIPITKSKTTEGLLALTMGGKGELLLSYKGTTIQKVTYMISLQTLIIFGWYLTGLYFKQKDE